MSDGQGRNILFILSDEHNRTALGCHGHPLVRTPTLDALAARGTRFTSAYCNSPVCVPSRASLATGRHPHEVRSWDNATPYAGTPKSWHEMLRDGGVDVVSVGKLHFRGGDDYGFTEELIPLHVVDGVGDLKGLLRDDTSPRAGMADLAGQAGPGESHYTGYDRKIAATAQDWLRRRAERGDDRPFALFVSFVTPHFPLVAPPEFYALYEDQDLAALSQGLTAPAPRHPVLEKMRRYFDYDSHFDDDSRTRALRAYFGMVSFLDSLVGSVIDALEESGFASATRVLYSSDHGDNLGNREFWGKALLHEDSAAVPMILAGDGIPEGAVVDTPVSLIDVAPTALDCLGLDADPTLPGDSLIGLASTPTGRAVLSQYHGAGSVTGQFMLRRGRWKYVHFVGAPPQLFDLQADPEERTDLGADPGHEAVRARLLQDLLAICDPTDVTALAFADQAKLIARHGGAEAIRRGIDIAYTPPPA